MNKSLMAVIDKDKYYNDIFRKELEEKMFKAIPESAVSHGIEWTCLVSLDGLEDERWVAKLFYKESNDE